MFKRNQAHDIAETYLLEIRDIADRLKKDEADAEAALKKVAEEWAPGLQKLRDLLAEKEKELLKFLKAKHEDLFAASEISVLTELANGVLLYSKADKVSIPKNALKKAEEQGFTDAIKIAKSLDREAVEKWPDEKLFLIGAVRKPAEEYAYEIKEADGAKRPKVKLGGKKKGK